MWTRSRGCSCPTGLVGWCGSTTWSGSVPRRRRPGLIGWIGSGSVYDATLLTGLDYTVTIGGTDFSVIGIVAATGSDATTAANAYIPLDVAQTLSGQTGKISSVYVKAASSGDIGQIKTDLTKAVPGATVKIGRAHV